MALKLRRGIEANRLGITPVDGELIYTTDSNKLYVGDNTTVGGNLVAGLTGDKGQKGEIGADGADGVIGVDGAKGQKGEVGADGADGVIGVDGAKGQKGEVGVDGADGAIGAKGEVGATGETGQKGQKGQKGEVGVTGVDGDKGQKGEVGLGFNIAKTYVSVSDLTADISPTGIISGEFALIETGDVEDIDNSKLYLWNGSVYSYVSDLSGAAGITGPAGSDGSAGVKGDTGDVGTTGAKGQKGAIGETGATGVDGVKGQKGEVGSDGADGVIGVDGAKGQKGEVGVDGADGVIGVDGAKGQKGEIGGAAIPNISESAPISPEEGALWFDTSLGKTFIYINDGSSFQWVQTNPTPSAGAKGQKGEIGPAGTDGADGIIGVDGADGSKGQKGAAGADGVDGAKGGKGEVGLGFNIAKIYNSVAALTTDTSPTGIISGEFALIETGDVEDLDNAKLYLWNGSVYSYVSDLSGAAGITGPAGSEGAAGAKGQKGEIGADGADGVIGVDGAKGQKGEIGGAAIPNISESAPVSPEEGALWFDTSLAKTFIYVNDGTSSQWIQTNPTPSAGAKGQKGEVGALVPNISVTAPVSPEEGALWFDTELLRTFIYVNDGTSSQWIQTNPTSAAPGAKGEKGEVGVGAGLFSEVTASSTALAGATYIIDTTTAVTITLPSSATIGDKIGIIDGTGGAATNNITIARNGNNIQGLAENMIVSTNRAAFELVYYNATNGWLLTSV